MKIVCDTNIFISGIIYGGSPYEILLKASIKEIKIVISKDIIIEVARVLKVKFKWTDADIYKEIVYLKDLCEVVEPKVKVSKITKDLSDNKILECAVGGKVDYIVSGDKKHLLSIKKYKGIKTLSPQDFLKVLYANKK